MTENQNPEVTAEIRAWMEVWRTCVEQVLSQVSGQTMAFELSPEPVAAVESDLKYTVTASGAVQGEMALRLPADTAVRLAQKFLAETGPPPDVPSAEHKEALEELLRQVAGQAATALGKELGGKVQLQLTATITSAAADSTISLRTRDEAGTPVVMAVELGAELLSAIRARHNAKQQEAISQASTTQAPQPPQVETPEPPPPVPPEAASYQRLMDVLLEVKLRFGSRRMVLRDVLALSSGMVVELDNHINTPVDLLLDGRTIAQGEVVVVDGKYGLRVTQVFDPRPTA